MAAAGRSAGTTTASRERASRRSTRRSTGSRMLRGIAVLQTVMMERRADLPASEDRGQGTGGSRIAPVIAWRTSRSYGLNAASSRGRLPREAGVTQRIVPQPQPRRRETQREREVADRRRRR